MKLVQIDIQDTIFQRQDVDKSVAKRYLALHVRVTHLKRIASSCRRAHDHCNNLELVYVVSSQSSDRTALGNPESSRQAIGRLIELENDKTEFREGWLDCAETE